MADRTTTHSHDTSTPAMSAETVPSEEFVLVPREPTPKMIRAARLCRDDASWASRWGAMIAAAPTLSASHLAKGGDAEARRKRASELMAPLMELSEDELILLRHSLPVETLARLRAALTPPETAEAVPVAAEPDTSAAEREALELQWGKQTPEGAWVASPQRSVLVRCCAHFEGEIVPVHVKETVDGITIEPVAVLATEASR